MSNQHKIGRHATTVSGRMGTTHVVYHATHVVVFGPDGICLDSGGWMTATTKTRMNQTANQFGLGYHVYQKAFGWFVDYEGQTLPFDDGMVLKRTA